MSGRDCISVGKRDSSTDPMAGVSACGRDGSRAWQHFGNTGCMLRGGGKAKAVHVHVYDGVFLVDEKTREERKMEKEKIIVDCA